MICSKITTILAFAASVIGCFLSGCLPAPQFIDLTQKGEIAIVSFSLDRSITMENSKEIDRGPGLLQKMVKGKEDAEDEYFQYHQQALDNIWIQFKENIGDVLLGISITDLNEIVNNEQLLSLTMHKENKVLGQDIASGARMLSPDGLNYVNAYDSKLLDSICVLLDSDLLLLVENSARFDEVPPPIKSEGGKLIIAPTAKAYVSLKTNICIYEKGKGQVVNKEFVTKSDDKMLVVWRSSDPKDYPKLMMQANAKCYEQIKQYFLYQKGKVSEQKPGKT